MIPISFGKSYISKIPVYNLQTNKKELFDFVQYDSVEDSMQIEDTSKEWGLQTLNGSYADFIAQDIERDNDPTIKYYGLEDKNENAQAICEIQLRNLQSNDGKNRISFIVTNPEHAHGSKTRKYSKLGTSLFREIVKLAKQNKAESIHFEDHSGGFWDAMPCVIRMPYEPFENSCAILGEDYDECLRKLDTII